MNINLKTAHLGAVAVFFVVHFSPASSYSMIKDEELDATPRTQKKFTTKSRPRKANSISPPLSPKSDDIVLQKEQMKTEEDESKAVIPKSKSRKRLQKRLSESILSISNSVSPSNSPKEEKKLRLSSSSPSILVSTKKEFPRRKVLEPFLEAAEKSLTEENPREIYPLEDDKPYLEVVFYRDTSKANQIQMFVVNKLLRLGSGAQGDVYKARKINIQDFTFESVAAKIYKKPSEDYKNEVQVLEHLGRLKGNTSFNDGTSYVFMPYYDGAALSDVLYEFSENPPVKRQIDERQRLILAKEVAKAINELHNNSVLHGDIKPENFIVSGFGDQTTVYPIDFGRSEILPKGEIYSTRKGMYRGTFGYMAPEMYCEKEKVMNRFGKPAEIWATLVVLSEIYSKHNYREFLNELDNNRDLKSCAPDYKYSNLQDAFPDLYGTCAASKSFVIKRIQWFSVPHESERPANFTQFIQDIKARLASQDTDEELEKTLAPQTANTLVVDLLK